jgi:hypothetical protein
VWGRRRGAARSVQGQLDALYVPRAVMCVLDFDTGDCVGKSRLRSAQRPTAVGEWGVVTRGELELSSIFDRGHGGSARLMTVSVQYGHVEIVVATRSECADRHEPEDCDAAPERRAGAQSNHQQSGAKRPPRNSASSPSIVRHHSAGYSIGSRPAQIENGDPPGCLVAGPRVRRTSAPRCVRKSARAKTMGTMPR